MPKVAAVHRAPGAPHDGLMLAVGAVVLLVLVATSLALLRRVTRLHRESDDGMSAGGCWWACVAALVVCGCAGGAASGATDDLRDVRPRRQRQPM